MQILSERKIIGRFKEETGEVRYFVIKFQFYKFYHSSFNTVISLEQSTVTKVSQDISRQVVRTFLEVKTWGM